MAMSEIYLQFLILSLFSYSVRIMLVLKNELENVPYFSMLWKSLNNTEMTCFLKLDGLCQENHFKLFYKDRPLTILQLLLWLLFFSGFIDLLESVLLLDIFLDSQFHLCCKINDIKVVSIFSNFEIFLYLLIFLLLSYVICVF